jgi:serine/threonine-protein kinase
MTPGEKRDVPPDDATSDRALDSSADTAFAPSRRETPAIERFTPGTVLAGRYRIVAPIGRGGMGEIYRAEDLRLGQPVALKFLAGAVANDLRLLERLVEEVKIGRQISHPNVCRLYDIVETDGHRFLVMELVDGEDLASLLRRIGRLPGGKVLDLARGLCAGLAAAHDKGVLHRDLKPGNVLVDGQGHARIADFGLAALSGSSEAASFAGTLAYMAPEQISGQAATPQSDVFALGLVLYEALTGRRRFDGKTLDDLRAQHARSEEIRFESGLGADPSLRDAIARCLSRDPAERPPSARALMALLPGGDPLQAAILAGETPSPEMVAAAAEVGDLPPRQAWGGLLTGLALLLALVAVHDRITAHRVVPLTKSPDALAVRAQEVARRLGYGGEGGDTADGFTYAGSILAAAERRDPALAGVDLRTVHPGAIRYFHRWSPTSLASDSWIPQLPWLGPPQLGRVLPSDPPLDTPGQTLVMLDRDGRLVRFVGVPDDSVDPATRSVIDWSGVLAEAGLSGAALEAVPPVWTAPTDTDAKAAWLGAFLDQPGVRFRFEAAAYRGRVVFFDVVAPWVRPAPTGAATGAATDPLSLRVALATTFGTALLLVFVGVQLVNRNLRLGRGDRRGAFRLALAIFFLLTLAQTVRADHTVGAREYALIVAIVSQGCYGAIVVWASYIAIEPAVRRRWPGALISTARFLQGRVFDPMVARDALAGLVLGVASVLLVLASNFLHVRTLDLPWTPNNTVISSLSSPRQVAYYVLLGPCLGIVYSVSLLFIRFVARTLLGTDRRAWAALFLFTLTPVLAGTRAPGIDLPVAVVFCMLGLFGLARFGLLASAVQFAVFMSVLFCPLTLDSSDWYFGRSLVVLLGLASLMAVAAYGAIGGKPLLGRLLADV